MRAIEVAGGDLWRLGRRFEALVTGCDRRAFRLRLERIEDVDAVLAKLGVSITEQAFKAAGPEGRVALVASLHAAICEGAKREFGDEAARLFELARHASTFHDLMENGHGPSLALQRDASAHAFMHGYADLSEDSKAELAELHGWVEAYLAGWIGSCETTELRVWVDAAFELSHEPAERLSFKTAPLEHFITMAILHRLVSVVGSEVEDSFEGNAFEGNYGYSNQQDRGFWVAWNREAIVGLAEHLYASGEMKDETLFADPPQEVVPLLRVLIEKMGETGYTCGFWVTAHGRDLVGSEDGGLEDGRQEFLALGESAATALYLMSWRDMVARREPPRGGTLTTTQAELVEELALRAREGGAQLTGEEIEVLLESPQAKLVEELALRAREGAQLTAEEIEVLLESPGEPPEPEAVDWVKLELAKLGFTWPGEQD